MPEPALHAGRRSPLLRGSGWHQSVAWRDAAGTLLGWRRRFDPVSATGGTWRTSVVRSPTACLPGRRAAVRSRSHCPRGRATPPLQGRARASRRGALLHRPGAPGAGAARPGRHHAAGGGGRGSDERGRARERASRAETPGTLSVERCSSAARQLPNRCFIRSRNLDTRGPVSPSLVPRSSSSSSRWRAVRCVGTSTITS